MLGTGAPGDDRPVKFFKTPSQRTSREARHFLHSMSSGYIWELAGPPEESIYEDTPYEMSQLPIIVRKSEGSTPSQGATIERTAT